MLKLPKRGGNGASQGDGGGGGEKEEKTPARKHCENDKHPLISRAWPLFRKYEPTNQNRRTIAPEAHFTSDKIITNTCVVYKLLAFLREGE